MESGRATETRGRQRFPVAADGLFQLSQLVDRGTFRLSPRRRTPGTASSVASDLRGRNSATARDREGAGSAVNLFRGGRSRTCPVAAIGDAVSSGRNPTSGPCGVILHSLRRVRASRSATRVGRHLPSAGRSRAACISSTIQERLSSPTRAIDARSARCRCYERSRGGRRQKEVRGEDDPGYTVSYQRDHSLHFR
jgi:hypothetical protein